MTQTLDRPMTTLSTGEIVPVGSYAVELDAWYAKQATKTSKPKTAPLGRYIPGTLILATFKQSRRDQNYEDEWRILAADWKVENVATFERLGYHVRPGKTGGYGYGDPYFAVTVKASGYRPYVDPRKRQPLESPNVTPVTVYRDFGGKGLASTRRYVSLAACAVMECTIAREVDGWTNSKPMAREMHRHHDCPFADWSINPVYWKCLCGTPEYAMYYQLARITTPEVAS